MQVMKMYDMTDATRHVDLGPRGLATFAVCNITYKRNVIGCTEQRSLIISGTEWKKAPPTINTCKLCQSLFRVVYTSTQK